MPTKLADICRLVGGYAFKSGDFKAEGVPVIKIADVTGGGSIDYSQMQCVSESIANKASRFAPEPRDTLISMTGANVGKTARTGYSDPEARINQRVGRFVPHKALGYSKDYIHYVVSSDYAYSYFSTAAYGSAQPNISGTLVESLPIPDFSPAIANQIGEFLSSLDDKIELNRRMNKTLEAMAQAIFRDWFVDFGPTRRKLEGATDPVTIMGGLVTDPTRAQELADLFPATLGDDGLPEGWRETPIGRLAEIVGGSTPSTAESAFWDGGTILWATPKDLSKLDGLHLFETERRITTQGLSKISSGLSPEGTVLLSSRAPIGYLAITTGPTAVNQGFIAIRPSSEFPTAYALCWCKENMELVKANANGSTFQEISKGNFRPLPVIDGRIELRNAFADLAQPLLDLSRIRSDENRSLASTRNLLLPKLMSGEIRLGVAEELVEAAQ